MKTLIIILDDLLLEEMQRVTAALNIAENRYIHEAIDHYNRFHKRRSLKSKLRKESVLTQKIPWTFYTNLRPSLIDNLYKISNGRLLFQFSSINRKSSMSLFYRHKISSFFLLLYLLWWLYMIYYMLKTSGEPICDPSPIVFILLTPIWAFVYSFVFFIKYFISKSSNRSDYLFFIWICTCPLLIGCLCLI